MTSQSSFLPLAALLALGLAAPVHAQVEAAGDRSPATEPVHAPGEHAAAPAAPEEPKRPELLAGYGNGGFAITTAVPQAQAFFSNGMELGAAFAHKASREAMDEAVRLDPSCAMCLWGSAYMAGPNLNIPADREARKPLLAKLRDAARLAKADGTALERELIAALTRRMRSGDTGKRDRDYLKAMEALAARYPANDAVQFLAADAAMVAAGGPAEWKSAAERAMALLEPVLARAPDYTPAIHFYIHAAEAAGQSAKAEPHADALAPLAPKASHLVHMPSHTFYWVGRYQDAADTNLSAVRVDYGNAERLGHTGEHGVFDLPYHAHNVIFGLGGAMMAEDSRTALTLARPLVAAVEGREESHPVMQLLASAGYFALGRFDDPASVRKLAEPKLPYLKAAWHYARGEAAAFEADKAALANAIAAIPDSIPAPEAEDGEDAYHSPAPDQMLHIVKAVLEGRLAMLENRPGDAAASYRKAAEIEETEDFSVFADPPAFWYPVRRDLAAALLAQGDFEGAKREAEATLLVRPKDPVTLRLLEKIAADQAG